MVGASSFLLALVSLAGAPAQAQQSSKLTISYSKAARAAVAAIEADSSAPQDGNSEDIEIATTQAIDVADEKAATDQERSFTETLRQVYELKRRDNTLLRAYRILMEVDGAEADSNNDNVRRTKDFAVSQFADGQAAILDSESACFQQLEQSLTRRLPNVTACSEWIEKSKMPEKDSSKADASNLSSSLLQIASSR